MHSRTVFQHQAAAPIWNDMTSVRLGDCPVPMRSDQYSIWMGPDGKWTDEREEQAKLVKSSSGGEDDK